MITSLRLVNFKNFADETLRVGPFTVIVGANASGKSNIRDAFRFLHGIGRGYTLTEILGGKHGDGGYVEWTGIRGAPTEIVRFKPLYPNQPSTFAMHVEATCGGTRLYYFIEVGFDPTAGFILLEEKLRTASETIYTMNRTDGLQIPKSEIPDNLMSLTFNQSIPALSQIERYNSLPFDDIQGLTLLTDFLRNIRFMELSPESMREPSMPGFRVLSDSGQNLPTVLETICSDPARKSTLMSWVHELTPMDIKDFEFPRDPSGRVHLRIIEKNGRSVSAGSASDGTLRFLAILATMFGGNPSVIHFFEEIDSGIHPNRLWLLVDLFERQTEKNGIQVITTTHSPDLLNFINDKTFENTSITYRDDEWEDSIIRPVVELPNARELRIPHGIGRLHSTGWMETMLAFTDGYDEEDRQS